MNYKLKDLIQIKNGSDYKKLNRGDVPVYGTGGVMTYVDDYLCDGESVLLPRKGTLDNVMYVNGKFWTVDTMYWTEINKERVLPQYLYYYLSLLDMSRRDSGSTLPSMTFDAYYTLDIDVPSLDIQQRVINIIEPIDRKVKNNNKINDNLHKVASAVFDYYFLQYGFIDYNGSSYHTNNYSLNYNKILKRYIPNGFKVHHIEDYCNIFTGKKDVNQALDSGKYRFYSCAPSYKYSNDKIYEGPAILISGKGSYTGRTVYVDTAFDLYQRTYACTNKDNVDKDLLIYIYYWLLRFLVPQISGGTHGSAIPYIVKDDIAKLPILYNNEVVSLFVNRVKPLLVDITLIEEENLSLVKLRDNLLPLFMSGQATIAD